MNSPSNPASFRFAPGERMGAETRWMMWVKWLFKSCGLVAVIFLAALPSVAQLQVGDNWRMNLSGNIGYSYTGNVDNGDSTHSMGFYGDANLSGSFYNPNFISFNIQPYYDRSQANSVFGNLTNSSGVSGNVNFFSGSHFPGSVSYAKGRNNTSEFGVPDSQIGLAQHGDLTSFGVSWSALLPNLPTLTTSYTVGNGTSSIFGSSFESSQSNKTLMLLSTYSLAGFRMSGGYTHRNVDTNFSQLSNGISEPVFADNSSDTFQFDAQHALPLSGSFNVGLSRTSYGYKYQDSISSSSSGASDTFTSIAAFRPTRKLSVSVSANYNDSLLGSVPETILSGGSLVTTAGGGKFRSLLLSTDAYYPIFRDLTVHGDVSHIRQEFFGQTYDSTRYGGSVNYSLDRKFLGSLTFSLVVFDYASEQGNGALGFVGNVNFNRKVHRWDLSSNFSYAQNVQTLIAVYTTSSYGWVFNTRRRLANRTYFAAGYGGSHSGITQQAGSSNSSERVSSSLTWRTYSLGGFYSKSNGEAILTSTGLVSVPGNLPPSVFLPGALMTYNSKAIGANASAVFIRRLTVSLAYAEGSGSTIDPAISTFNSTKLYNAIMQYRLRKIYIDGGFTRLRQSVGTVGTPPVNVTSYFIGFSRWFNFF